MSVTTHAIPSCIIIQIHSTLKAIKDYIPIYLTLNLRIHLEDRSLEERNVELRLLDLFLVVNICSSND